MGGQNNKIFKCNYKRGGGKIMILDYQLLHSGILESVMRNESISKGHGLKTLGIPGPPFYKLHVSRRSNKKG